MGSGRRCLRSHRYQLCLMLLRRQRSYTLLHGWAPFSVLDYPDADIFHLCASMGFPKRRRIFTSTAGGVLECLLPHLWMGMVCSVLLSSLATVFSHYFITSILLKGGYHPCYAVGRELCRRGDEIHIDFGVGSLDLRQRKFVISLIRWYVWRCFSENELILWIDINLVDPAAHPIR